MFPSDDARWVRSTALVSDEFVVNAGVLVAYYTKNMLDEYVDRGCDAVRRRRRNVPFRRRALIQLDDALQVQSTALVSDEFLVNADVLVADFARNMLDEYVVGGYEVARRRYDANTLQ